jgi:rubrerythrin
MDVIDVLKQILEEEKTGAERYRELAQEVDDAESKAVFEALAREEEKHYQTVKARLTAIKLRRQKG